MAATAVETYSLEDWRAEATRRGNGDLLDAPMLCPLCGNIATPRQFKEAGADPGRAAQECIGRIIGARGTLKSKRPVPQPCDWAAFGLFGTLNGGVFVTMPDGKQVHAFSFAESVS